MEFRTIRFTSALMVLFCASLLAASARAQTGGLGAPQAVKAPPPPAMVGPTPPTAQEKAMALAIANYATAQCGGKDAEAAPDCRVKALWAAAQCPGRMPPVGAGVFVTKWHARADAPQDLGFAPA